LSIREDLLNKYAEETLNFCTAASNSTMHDALDSSANLVKEKEQQILQLENKLDFACSQLHDYKEKNKAHNRAHAKIVEEEKYKFKKYCTLFRLMFILYVARIMIPTM
jgi:isoleucyl-tRNA synthetase